MHLPPSPNKNMTSIFFNRKTSYNKRSNTSSAIVFARENIALACAYRSEVVNDGTLPGFDESTLQTMWSPHRISPKYSSDNVDDFLIY